MTKNKIEYRQDIAFIDRQKELQDLKAFVDKKPSEILFIHGPKSSGKTTLLFKFLEQVEKEQHLDIKFLNLRKIPAEFTGLVESGIKPVLIIDELQLLDNIYMNNGRDKRLIIELFNFFVAMTKESHLAHIIIASSDGYFINTVYTDSRLKKTSAFYRVDYLDKKDTMEWLLNLEKYSKIKDYTLNARDAESIWDTVGGSMWEIQYLLGRFFENPFDDELKLYKKKMRSMIVDYVVKPEQKDIERLLRHFVQQDELPKEMIKSEDEKLLRDMVRNNILYFDPTEATYYPQGRSCHLGIRSYFEDKKEKR